MTEKKTIYTKILEVQKAVEAIQKRGYNSFHKYSYATEADVLEVKKIMNTHGLIAYPDVVGYETIQRGDSLVILQHIEYTVVDAETGDSVKAKVLGAGEDKGDKGAYKAATGGNKYFYLKFFGVATDDDPENETQKPASRKAPTQAGEPQNPNTGPVSVADFKNAIVAFKQSREMDWPQITDITGETAVLKLDDLPRLRAAFNKLMAYAEHFKKAAS